MWLPPSKVFASDGADPDDEFGYSMALSGGILAVGAYLSDAVYVYDVAVGAASAAVGLFLVAADAGKSIGCLSPPSRASSADAPEEKEADELEAASPTSPPDIPT